MSRGLATQEQDKSSKIRRLTDTTSWLADEKSIFIFLYAKRSHSGWENTTIKRN
jgi:hypothetical protein